MPTEKETQKAIADIEAFLERRNRNRAPAWRPEPGTVMAGEVVGMHMGPDMGYGEYPIVTYKLDSGEYVAVHAFHTLLRQTLAELKTDIGKRQILSYMGKRQKTNPTEEEVKKGLDSYHDYYVENEGESNLSGTDENFSF